jgi:hypothetical protein
LVRNFHPSDFCTALKWLVSSFIHRRRRSGASQSLASWSTSTTFSIVNRWTRPLMHFCFSCGTLYTWDSASRWIPYLSISSSVHLQQIKDILVILLLLATFKCMFDITTNLSNHNLHSRDIQTWMSKGSWWKRLRLLKEHRGFWLLFRSFAVYAVVLEYSRKLATPRPDHIWFDQLIKK